jgi:hypothetical protein
MMRRAAILNIMTQFEKSIFIGVGVGNIQKTPERYKAIRVRVTTLRIAKSQKMMAFT